MKKAKEDWIGAQCEEIETCLNKTNSKRAYQLVKDLTSEKQGRSSTIRNKSGKCLTEEKEILSRWTEYCSELYNYESCGDNAVLDCSQPPEEDLQPILREEIEIALASLNKSTACGCQRSAVLHLENSKSKKGDNFVKRNRGLPPLLILIPLLIVDNYSEFQVNCSSNNRDIRKCQSFRTTPPTTTPGLLQWLDVFFENSRAKKGKSAGVDNIPAELVQAGGETMIDVLTEVCNRIWRTGEWHTHELSR